MTRAEYEEKLKYLQEEIDKLKEAEIEEDEFPSIGCKYYYINDGGYVDVDEYEDDDTDEYRKNYIGIYETEEDCKKAREIKKAFKEASLKFKPNWSDSSQEKYFLCYSWNTGCLLIDHCFCHNQKIDYFESLEDVKNLIDRFGEEDVIKYYL